MMENQTKPTKETRERSLERMVTITAPIVFAALATVGFNYNEHYNPTSDVQFYKDYAITLLVAASIGYLTTKWYYCLDRSGFFNKPGLGGQS